jgi:hypothetical protein
MNWKPGTGNRKQPVWSQKQKHTRSTWNLKPVTGNKKSTPLSAECLQNESHSNIIPFGDTGKLLCFSKVVALAIKHTNTGM